MPQELQSTNQQSQTAVEEAKTTTVNKSKIEQKQNKNDDTSKSLKRTAPSDVASQGDAKRKATQGSKKSSEKPIENVNLKATDPTAIAANAAAILSSVPSSVAQNVVGQSTESTKQVLSNTQFDDVLLTATTNSVNSMNSPIAVAPLIPNQQPAMNDLSPALSNMEEFLSSAAATAQAQAQPQDSSGNKRAVSTRNLSNDERRQRRLLRNRVAAKECRRKKKAYVADLEEKVTRLEEENSRLSKEIDELNTKLGLNVLKIEENSRLRKEIEELKTKLNITQQADLQKETRSKTNDEIESIKQEVAIKS